MGQAVELSGPDFRRGVAVETLREGEPVLGHADGQPALMTRYGDDVYVIGGVCTHYGGPLADGLATDGVIRCPWHHACFSLRTGDVLAAPALNGVARWDVVVEQGVARVTERREPDVSAPRPDRGTASPSSDALVIVGAGAAGSAAAEVLWREAPGRRVVLIDGEAAAPYDRPNLSKDYLAGTAPEEWLPLRPPGFYEERGIERRTEEVVSLDLEGRRVHLASGESLPYGRLLIATGSSPIRLRVPGADGENVYVLRSLDDCRRLIAAATAAREVVIAGASFIGMEAAAALRKRGAGVTVVAPERVPFEKTLGESLGAHLRRVHEGAGVRFRLGRTLAAIRASEVELDDGSVLPADVVLLGVGVRPRVDLAQAAGLGGPDGIPVNEFLETRAPGVYAAGDVALYPEPLTGAPVRVEHWVVAQRQGQTAARNMLGGRERFASVPFFWTEQHGFLIRYVGYGGAWDAVREEGSIAAGDGVVRYLRDGAVRAVATVGRDREALHAEVSLEAAGGSPQRSAVAPVVGGPDAG